MNDKPQIKVKEEKKPAIVRKMGVEPLYDKESNTYQWSKSDEPKVFSSVVQNRLNL